MRSSTASRMPSGTGVAPPPDSRTVVSSWTRQTASARGGSRSSIAGDGHDRDTRDCPQGPGSAKAEVHVAVGSVAVSRFSQRTRSTLLRSRGPRQARWTKRIRPHMSRKNCGKDPRDGSFTGAAQSTTGAASPDQRSAARAPHTGSRHRQGQPAYTRPGVPVSRYMPVGIYTKSAAPRHPGGDVGIVQRTPAGTGTVNAGAPVPWRQERCDADEAL